MFIPPYFITSNTQNFVGSLDVTIVQTYPDLYPNPPTTVYIPRIYGFKIYKKKGSRFWEQNKNVSEITHYGDEQLKKLKALFTSNLHNNQGGN